MVTSMVRSNGSAERPRVQYSSWSRESARRGLNTNQASSSNSALVSGTGSHAALVRSRASRSMVRPSNSLQCLLNNAGALSTACRSALEDHELLAPDAEGQDWDK